MKNSWIIAKRELKERISSRSFLLLATLGPLIVLALIYLLFTVGGNEQQRWNVLISDPRGLMDGKILSSKDSTIRYSFVNEYIEIEDFAENKAYLPFNALVEINEKILSNKTSFLFYREKPSFQMSINIRYHVERRLEELLADQFTQLSANEFRKIKQPIQIGFRNVYDPKDESSDLAGWVGLFFGTLIVLFIFLFGMSILRSISREKTSRIVELLMATVHPRSLMLGKIIGVGLSAMIQFLIWFIVIAGGLYFLRTSIFVDIYDAKTITQGATSDYNQFVELVFERIQFSGMLFYFLLFFIVGYLFYGAFFAALGAIAGSESDGQQFLLPLVAVLFFAIYAGYFAFNHPESGLTTFFEFFPFTSPVVVLVKFANGYPPEQTFRIAVSIGCLLISSIGVLALAGRLYQNGILQFGHSIGIRSVFSWIKKK